MDGLDEVEEACNEIENSESPAIREPRDLSRAVYVQD
jgi:hypothetical protein